MNIKDKVAVCSRSFSKNPFLRKEILSKYKNVKFNDSGLSLSGDTLVNFLKGYNKAIIALETMDEYVLSALPELEVIGKYGIGLDKIDIKAMNKLKKRLGFRQGTNKRSVSELAVSNMISLLRYVPISQKEVKEGIWKQNIGSQLTGKIVGIIGCGNIGKDLIKLLQPFKCKVLVNDIVEYKDFYKEYEIENIDIDSLLERSDIVSLHVPLNESTKNMLCARRLNKMKQGAILINLARGGLLDEKALKKALKSEKLFGAAIDVFEIEPPSDFEFLNMPNLIVTPHIGGSSIEAVVEMGLAAIVGLDKNEVPNF